MALGILSEDCVCTFLCGGALGTKPLRELKCLRLVLVVNNALLWKEAGLLCWFVCHV